MTKNEWLQICKLNQEWYFKSIGLDNEQINRNMPKDNIFDDGRIEFFQENFKPSIDEEKLEELAREWCKNNADIKEDGWVEYDGGHEAFKEGYRKAKEE